jgi:hypothetical protein
MPETDDWIVAGSGSGTMWDESTGPVTGTYVKKRSDVGPNGSMVYTLRYDTGEEVGVWGSSVIDTKFKEIPIGSLVQVMFLGKATGKRGTQYKDYEVKYKPPQDPRTGEEVAIKDLDATEVNLDDIPF